MPLQNKRIPIIADDLVDPKFGTGCVKVTPAHDPADYEMAQRHQLPFTVVIAPDGSMTREAGEDFIGLDRMEARKAVVEELEELQLLLKVEPYVHNVGYSERSHVPIEPYLSEQWFLRYPALEAATRAVEDGSIQFHPDRWSKTYTHWMRNLKDWCISRQLWWGHRIPVWYRKSPDGTRNTDDPTAIHVDIDPPADPENWEQDPDVLDTWFSSWLWPFATMGWPDRTPVLNKFYPTADLVTGPDIIFFWVARMIMAGYEYMEAKPFAHVYFTGIIRDKLGRKMSKSLGNSPDPLDLINKFGADALRFGVMRSAPLGQDVLYDEQHVELGRNFCNKLWNACRFRQMQAGATQGEINPALLTPDDKWILLKLDQAIREIDDAFAGYRFTEVTQTLYRVFWSEYCDWYIEASKAVFQDTSNPERIANTLAVVDFVLSHLLRLFHPFLPFITEELWHGLGYHQDMPPDQGGRSILFAPWPKPLEDDIKLHYVLDSTDEQRVDARCDLVSRGRNLRREFHIPANKKVTFAFKPAGIVDPHDAAVLKLLLHAETLKVDPDYIPAKGTPSASSDLGDLFLSLTGLIDPNAERIRLEKEKGKAELDIQRVLTKLENPDFVQKVPPKVLDDHRSRLTEAQARLQQIQAALDAITG